MADAPLTAEDVRRVARLARLALPQSEVEPCRYRLASVLGYMERLKQLNLDGVEPLSHVLSATTAPTESANRLDPDEPGAMLPTEALMRQAPDSLPPYVKVPKVLDEGGAA